jgi:hypothetical protein
MQQQVIRQTMQVSAKAVGQVAMIAETIRREFALQFFVAILGFAAIGIFVVRPVGTDARSWSIGDHRALVRAALVDFALKHDPTWNGPTVGLVLKARKQSLRGLGLLELLLRFSQ